MAIKAPFNFVPLNEKVFFPEWAEQISHDIPFSDAVSGILNLTIEAASPIFVGEPGRDEQSKEFCHTEDGRYFIPATTLKGAFRNVLEIISYGKMTQAQNQSFGIRELYKGIDQYFYQNKVIRGEKHCGWLMQVNGKYYLDDCGKPWRISPEEIEYQKGISMASYVINRANFNDSKDRTAKVKYDLVKNFQLKRHFKVKRGKNKTMAYISDYGEEGTIVFTGQPGATELKARKGRQKFYEFVFPAKIEKERIPVPDSVINEFETVHQNSEDFTKFRQVQLNKGERIPVFFLYTKNGGIDSMGLSYMYKYPAFHSVYKAIPRELLRQDRQDLAECIFGYTGKQDSLKGRVQFSPAFLQGTPDFLGQTPIALSTPHPSYYPLYLGDGQTWNSGGTVRIAGRKRYPVRNKIFKNVATDVMTPKIRPLQAGTIFKSKIRFHNLRPMELGALLAAITFCGDDRCYHSIGMGKPLGYGKTKVKVDIDSLQSVQKKEFTTDALMKFFQESMEQNFPGWTTSVQLQELKAMAMGIPEGRENEFVYMKMSTNRKENEFLEGKRAYAYDGKQLGLYTQILNHSVPNAKMRKSVSPYEERTSYDDLIKNEKNNKI